MGACCRWTGLLLVVGVWYTAASVRALLAAASRKDFSHGVVWWESREIEAGRLRPDHGTRFHASDLRFMAVMTATTFMDIIGHLYQQRVDRYSASFLRVVPRFTGPTDPEGRFCQLLLDYKWLHVSQAGSQFPQVRANSAEMAEFIRFCRQEWHHLSEEEQHLLGEYRRTGHIPDDVVVRPPYDWDALGAQARAAIEPYEEGERLTEEELRRMINVSIGTSSWVSEGPTHKVHPWLKEDAERAVEDMMGYYKKMNLRTVPRIASDWREVGKAIHQGTIRVFDAAPLFPSAYFNISIKDLADREERASERIVTLFNGCKPRSLKDFASLNEELTQGKATVDWNLACPEAISFDRSLLSGEQKLKLWQGSGCSKQTQYCHVGYVNNRRLKKFHASMPDMVKKMSLEDEIFREEGYLWLGPIRGGFHYDEEANVYVQLSGESDVFLIPPSHVDVFTLGQRFKNLPSRHELAEDPVMRDVPFHFFRMKPGEAVVFPSRTFHLFLAQTYDRIAVNFFFIPKWRKMEYTKHDWYSLEANVSLGRERLALRQLWARSFVSMYEETGKAIIYMGEKNEYI